MNASFKLAHYFIERLADPLAAVAERVAVRSPRFTRFCVSVARRYDAGVHRRPSLFAAAAPKRAPLGDRAATRLGAELIGEAIVVAAGLGVLSDTHRREARSGDELEARIAALEAAPHARPRGPATA